MVIYEFVATEPFRFDWPTFEAMAGTPNPGPVRRARFNGTAFQLRRRGYYTIGQVCKASGVPDSTIRDWEGALIPKFPRVEGIRAVKKDEFEDLVTRCRALASQRKRGWNFRRSGGQ